MDNILKEAYQKGVDILERHHVPHMLIGGLGIIAWGNPRLTVDVDWVIALHERDFIKVLREMKQVGFEFDEDDVIRTLQISGVVRVSYRGIMTDFIVGESEFEREAFQRRRRISFQERDVDVATPEDLVVYKVYAGRNQDLADIENILIRLAGKLDIPYIDRWIGWLTERFNNPAIEQRWATLRDRPVE